MQSIWLDGAVTPTDDPAELGDGREYDDIVVGAGITGLVAAVLLARAGRSVLVLEARRVGAVASGNTTAKLSVLQGTMLSTIRRQHSARLTSAYLDGNREGLEWLLRYCTDHGVPFQQRDAVTYAATPGGRDAVDREFRVARELGLHVERDAGEQVPFPLVDAVRLPGQAQIDPLELLQALVLDARSRGARVVQGVRVTGVRVHPLRGTCEVETPRGLLEAENVILATGIPFLDRGLYFAKVEPRRSYALAFQTATDAPPLPRAMYLSADQPGRTIRTVPWLGEERLIVGGNDHAVGRHPSPAALVSDLHDWTLKHFPGAVRTHAWSAQDYRSANLIPFVGWFPRGGGHIFLATGYNKWGFTNAAAAALRISADILGGHLPWAHILGHRFTRPSDVLRGAKGGVAVGWQAAKGWARSELRSNPGRPPSEGEGQVGHVRGVPVGVSRVEGRTCAVSVVCPHMGGVLTWNNAEMSWDCPLHGSRFAADGALLEGPAVRSLTPVRRTGHSRDAS